MKRVLLMMFVLILIAIFFIGCSGACKYSALSSKYHAKKAPSEGLKELRESDMSDMKDKGASLPSAEYSRMAMRSAPGMPAPMEDNFGYSSGGSAVPNQKPYDLTFFESYGVNPFVPTEDENFSTFGMDVDTASYTIVRRFLADRNFPDKDSVRTEEFINYFKQDYPDSNEIFSINLEGARSEFGNKTESGEPKYHLLKIGIKASEITIEERKPANMVFVVDVSGSMSREDRLEQVKRSMTTLAENLKDGDKVALVVYGSTGQVISDLTSNRNEIFRAIQQLQPSGSTNAEEGLTLAYQIAHRGFEDEKINRIILCSDGVANVGNTGADEILKKIKKESEKGITLTAIGFGMGNYNDILMEKLANHGDGNYYYIDSPEESDRIFANGAVGLLQTLAEDAKIQVEFNKDVVDRFRLLGYENRRLNKEDFRDDTVDAGEVGVGQSVTALYEIRIKDDALQTPDADVAAVRIRFKNLDTQKVEENSKSITVGEMNNQFESASPMFMFTSAVAEFAEILKDSFWAKDGKFDDVIAAAENAIDGLDDVDDIDEYREFVSLVRKAKEIKGNMPKVADNPDEPDDPILPIEPIPITDVYPTR